MKMFGPHSLRLPGILAACTLLAACGGGAAPAASPASPAASVAAAKPATSGAASAKPAAAGSASAKPAAGSAGSSAAPAAKTGTVRLMELTPTPDPNLSYTLMAQTLGLFQKHGVNVEIQHAGGGGPQKVQILVSGSSDVVMTDIISMYSAMNQAQGLPPSSRRWHASACRWRRRRTSPTSSSLLVSRCLCQAWPGPRGS